MARSEEWRKRHGEGCLKGDDWLVHASELCGATRQLLAVFIDITATLLIHGPIPSEVLPAAVMYHDPRNHTTKYNDLYNTSTIKCGCTRFNHLSHACFSSLPPAHPLRSLPS